VDIERRDIGVDSQTHQTSLLRGMASFFFPQGFPLRPLFLSAETPATLGLKKR